MARRTPLNRCSRLVRRTMADAGPELQSHDPPWLAIRVLVAPTRWLAGQAFLHCEGLAWNSLPRLPTLLSHQTTSLQVLQISQPTQLSVANTA